MRLLCGTTALLALGVGCTDATLFLNGDDIEAAEPVDPGLCGFEDADLAGFGHPGAIEFTPEEGGKVRIVEEGSDFSALVGEDELWFHGRNALLLRSNDLGDVLSVGVITTVPFVPRGLVFVVDQLSEVGAEGISLELRVLDGDTDDVLEEHEVPVHTGGYVPELDSGHSEIEGFPEITHFDGSPGQFVRETFDLGRYRREERSIRVQLRQHTIVQDNGFFTLLDNLCDGLPADPADGV